jgi:hypothetical protein
MRRRGFKADNSQEPDLGKYFAKEEDFLSFLGILGIQPAPHFLPAPPLVWFSPLTGWGIVAPWTARSAGVRLAQLGCAWSSPSYLICRF